MIIALYLGEHAGRGESGKVNGEAGGSEARSGEGLGEARLGKGKGEARLAWLQRCGVQQGSGCAKRV